MKIAVVIYSRHLSCWRRRRLTLLSLQSECADLHKCVYVRVNNSWSSFIYRRSEYKVILWIFANRLSIRKPFGIFVTSAKLWVHWLCTSTTASYTRVYLWIFSDYYGECEMADASTYLERSNRALHLSMACSSLHGREGRSQQSSLAFKDTVTITACWKVFFTLPLIHFNQSML